MANEIKKFLDEEGLKILWSQINLNDYPNNNLLMAVINAIDETKVDKAEIDDLILITPEDIDAICGKAYD